MTKPDTSGIDDLRQRLRSLGYLDAGVDRFVLAPAYGARGAFAIALLASLRIGILGGLLLGPAAALGVAAQLPGLVSGVRDGVVIATYMAVLFGAGIAGLALVAGLIVSLSTRFAGSSLARRGRLLSTAAGVAVAIASLAYLTMLWTAVRSGGGGEHAAFWSASGLAFAVGISLLLGHAVTLTGLALIVTCTGSPIRTRGVPGTSWRVMLTVGAVAFAAALVVFNRGIGADEPAPPRLVVVPSGLRIRVVAIDGFDPVVFDRLASAGRLPALSEAFGGAARLTLNDSAEARRLDPARLWTTIATGQPASVHGVRTLETRRVAGLQGALQTAEGSSFARLIGASTDLLRLTRPSIASGSDRREKTFWEVATEAGLRTVVVNWWATWPAASGHGVVLTDRATLRLERGGALDAEIAPAGMYERLAPRWPALRERASALASAALAGGSSEGDEAALVRRLAELDAMTLLLTEDVSDGTTDLSAVYLPGLDIAQHALLGGDAADLPSASAMSSRLQSLEAYYVALDRLLASVVRPGSGEIVVLITAPGRVAPGATGRLTIRGSVARVGSAIDAQATDVAPTILYALGVPMSRALAGKPLFDLFTEPYVARYTARYVATYGRPASRGAVGTGQPLDQEMIDRLRSLGYVR